MSDVTQLNQDTADNSNITIINNNLEDGRTTINSDLDILKVLEADTLICDKYTVISRLEVTTGEADLYICKFGGREYIAKLYRRQIAIKSEISEKLRSIHSPFVSEVYDTGSYNGYPIEILPYYRKGSLAGKKFNYEQLKNHIIPSLNEGLKVLHDNGIIHKDLKPSNIMLADNGQDVAIIDFGISSVREGCNTVVVTKTGMTPEYSAPETFRNLFLEESDYYSLGITIFELYCGFAPYSDMEAEEIEQYVSIQKIPLPKEMPEGLKDFINGVTYFDITNRKDKSNPNRRWCYDEVKRWCSGITQPLPGEGSTQPNVTVENFVPGNMKPYKFLGKTYTDRTILAAAMAENWEEGKKQIYRGLLSDFFRSFDQEAAGYCLDAEEGVTTGREDENIIFFRSLYKLGNINKFYWQGKVYDDLPSFGNEILNNLWNGDMTQNKFYADILLNSVLSQYLTIIGIADDKLVNAVRGLESSYRAFYKDNIDDRKYLYMMGYLLSGQRVLRKNGIVFNTVEELTVYIQKILTESIAEFNQFCKSMVDSNSNLDPQLEAWLSTLGKYKIIDRWKTEGRISNV
ncbi:hypothetical protein DWW31_17625 [Clostridium sp. AF15-17LB]|nr:hypothetical protein DWW31_17625 [Clostridium sp. AF15-17LB]